MFFNRRKGREELLSTATTYLAVGFMVLSVILAVGFNRSTLTPLCLRAEVFYKAGFSSN